MCNVPPQLIHRNAAPQMEIVRMYLFDKLSPLLCLLNVTDTPRLEFAVFE